MENQRSNGKEFEKSPWKKEQFTWTIKNFSKYHVYKTHSESFVLGGYPWRIIMYPKGSKNSRGYLSLSIYLNLGDLPNFHKSWRRYVNLELALTNQVVASDTIVKETELEFKESNSYLWHVEKFIHLSDLHNARNGFILDDTCIIQARIISIQERFDRRQVIDQVQEVVEVDCSPAQSISVKEISTRPSCDNLVDFKGLGRVEKEFVPLLEDVCSRHPWLIDNQRKRKRTPRFTEWAFNALGRVLYFLSTKEAIDMNEDGCHDLQVLWEELETFGFDLSWLKSSFERAINKKFLVQKFENRNRLRKDKDTKERELAMVTKQLIEEEKSFDEKDLYVKLGY